MVVLKLLLYPLWKPLYSLICERHGAADRNKDKRLTMAELGTYVSAKVREDAAIKGREQTPQLQGNTERVLVQW